MVVVRDITFAAMSEATLLPFHGRAHIAYVPRDGVILGLSKLARATKCLASKLQQQEAFTRSLMEAVQAEVGPAGVAVVVQANHLGPPGQPAAHVTSAVSGCFAESGSGQLVEFLTLLRLSGIAAAGQLLGHGAGPAAAAAPQLQHFAAAAEASSGHRCAAAGEPPGAPVGRAEMAAAVQELLEGVGEAPGRPVSARCWCQAWQLWHCRRVSVGGGCTDMAGLLLRVCWVLRGFTCVESRARAGAHMLLRVLRCRGASRCAGPQGQPGALRGVAVRRHIRLPHEPPAAARLHVRAPARRRRGGQYGSCDWHAG